MKNDNRINTEIGLFMILLGQYIVYV